MSEANLMRKIQIYASSLAYRLFRNNCGVIHYKDRWIRYGIANPGGSDLIGWRTVLIRPEMVGSSIAVFAAVEVKDRGQPTAEQTAFLKAVIDAGGIGLIARSEADLL